eukprot:GHVN01015225.1.p1 GENE.GHVN01015225.1~~GHVN01015225.1.p1  ORF type:complete len:416 (+),score=43.78 GHVN01015225.1:159-1406(+)
MGEGDKNGCLVVSISERPFDRVFQLMESSEGFLSKNMFSDPKEAVYRTKTKFCGYAVKFCPYQSGRFAVGTSQYFGIVGNGRLQVLRIPNGPPPAPLPGQAFTPLHELSSFDTNEAIFDCTWSEGTPNRVVTATGDGAVRIWDVSAPSYRPIGIFSFHKKECSSVDWNIHNSNLFLSGSWDGTVALWDATTGNNSPPACIFQHHSNVMSAPGQPPRQVLIYAAVWAPTEPHIFASGSSDGVVRVFDSRQAGPAASSKPMGQIGMDGTGEILCADWNKYSNHFVMVGSSNGCVSYIDLRRPEFPLRQFASHQLAVRRVRCSPHHKRFVASSSYDMTVRVWDLDATDGAGMYSCAEHHTEFVFGLDWSLFQENVLCSASWDRTVTVWNHLDRRLGPPPLGVKQMGVNALKMPVPGGP